MGYRGKQRSKTKLLLILTFEKSLAALTEGGVSAMEETGNGINRLSGVVCKGTDHFVRASGPVDTQSCALKESVQRQGRRGEPEQEKMN